MDKLQEANELDKRINRLKTFKRKYELIWKAYQWD